MHGKKPQVIAPLVPSLTHLRSSHLLASYSNPAYFERVTPRHSHYDPQQITAIAIHPPYIALEHLLKVLRCSA
jgi:hypothetical protein